MKEKGNISIEEIIQMGISLHYITEKNKKGRTKDYNSGMKERYGREV